MDAFRWAGRLAPGSHEVGGVFAGAGDGGEPGVENEFLAVADFVLWLEGVDLAHCVNGQDVAVREFDGLGIADAFGEGVVADDLFVVDVPGVAVVVADAGPHANGMTPMRVGNEDVSVGELDGIAGITPEGDLSRLGPRHAIIIGYTLPHVVSGGNKRSGDGEDPPPDESSQHQ